MHGFINVTGDDIMRDILDAPETRKSLYSGNNLGRCRGQVSSWRGPSLGAEVIIVKSKILTELLSFLFGG